MIDYHAPARTDADRKHGTAIMVWPKRNEPFPHGGTWGDWFERDYGETVEVYRDRVKQ